MKIFLVSMKQIGDYYVGERMKWISLEAENAGDPEYVSPRSAHCKVEDDESNIARWRENRDKRAALLDRIGVTIPSRFDDDDNEYKRSEHLHSPTFACTGAQLLEIMEVDDSITVKSGAAVATDSIPGMIERMEHLVKRFESIEFAAPMNGETIYNQKCDVHVPGQALSTYNETLLMEDACSDALQEALNVGWRIIAACPQPDNRRPDYILGRFNPTMHTAPDGANRRP
jgi:hypothetical protein